MYIKKLFGIYLKFKFNWVCLTGYVMIDLLCLYANICKLGVFFFFFNLFILFLVALGLCSAPAFLWLWRARATLCCGVRAYHCSGFSCCGAQALGARISVVAAHGLLSAGSVIVAHRLSCSAECGIFLDQG